MTKRCIRCANPSANHTSCLNDSPTRYFGFTVWAHLIPPFVPEEILILGDADKIIMPLIKMVHGAGIPFFIGYEEGKKLEKFDFVCVDLWEKQKPKEYIFLKDFALYLNDICKKMFCVNVPHIDMKRFQKNIETNTPLKFRRGILLGENVVMWFGVREEGEDQK